MLSVTPISMGQAGTYYQRDSYYSTEISGVWAGKAAETLKLFGEILHEDWQLAIGGFNPATGEQLVQAGAKGDHRAATDLTFSPPKSVTIAALVANRTDITEAHQAAVNETLKFVEKYGAQARVTKEGITKKVQTGNLLIAIYEHSTSRELDPQLHTHCPVLNMTQLSNGSWKAVSNEKFFENKMFFGQFYRNELAANLKELGYQIESGSKGLFEIKGMDIAILKEYSRRSEQIMEQMETMRTKYPSASESQLREFATLGSRAVKDHNIDMRELRRSWESRLQEYGITKDVLNHQIDENMREKSESREPLGADKAVRLAGQILTERESTFSREELLITAARLTVGDSRVRSLEMASRELIKMGEHTRLKDGSYTTREMQQMERKTVQMMQDGKGKVKPVMTKEEVHEVLQDHNHTKSQMEAVEHVLTSPDKVLGIQGYAGVGKTTALNTIRDQLEANGYSVKGMASTGKAADGMQREANIRSTTISRDVYHSEGPADFHIVDEASMAGSRDLHNIIERAVAEGSRVVLVGDTEQLQAIQAGRMFKDLQTNGMATAKMQEIIRQKDGTYKDIVRSVVYKKIDDAFVKLEKYEKIHEIEDRTERLEAIAKDYAGRKDWRDTVVLSGKNADTREVNSLIRETLRERGEIGRQDYELIVRSPVSLSPTEQRFGQSYEVGQYVFAREAGVGGMKAGGEARIIAVDTVRHRLTAETKSGVEREIDLVTDGGKISIYEERHENFTRGEKVLFTKNDSMLGVRNGQIGDIQEIREGGHMIVTLSDGSNKSFSPDEYKYITHGDAITTFKSQSMTKDNAIVHAPADGGQSYNSLYVQATRGRHDLQLYTDNIEELKEQVKHEQDKASTVGLEQDQHKTIELDEKASEKIMGDIHGGCQDRDTGEEILERGSGLDNKNRGLEGNHEERDPEDHGERAESNRNYDYDHEVDSAEHNQKDLELDR